jgi:hypothetical protein
MKKIYLTLGLSALLLSATAQQAIRKGSKAQEAASVAVSKKGHDQVSVTVCDTITTMGPSDSLFMYTAGTNTTTGLSHGYVVGNNDYGDLKKATFLPGSLIPTGSTITGVIVLFYKGSATKGTHGTGNVSIEILNGDTTTGPTGAAVATSTASLATIGTTGTLVGNELIYTFPFAAVAAPAAGFFASLTLPTAAGDTAALFSTRNLSAPRRNYAWEFYGAWGDFRTDWGLPTMLPLLPIICYNSVGIHNNILEASIAFFPNPSNGEFNFAVALPTSTNITVNVVNTLGQTVFTKVENNISSAALRYDLSSLGKGVYFAHISDSQNNKTVKKVIIE